MAKNFNLADTSPFLLATPGAAAAVPEGWVVRRRNPSLTATVHDNDRDRAQPGDRVARVVLDVDEIQIALDEARAHGYTPSWWPTVLDTLPQVWNPGDLVTVVAVGAAPAMRGRVIAEAADNAAIIGTWATADQSDDAANTKLAEVTGDTPPPFDSCLTTNVAFLAAWETIPPEQRDDRDDETAAVFATPATG